MAEVSDELLAMEAAWDKWWDEQRAAGNLISPLAQAMFNAGVQYAESKPVSDVDHRPLEAFASFVVALDEVRGQNARRTITLQKLIDKARAALRASRSSDG